MGKDTNYCCFLPQIRETIIETNPEIWNLNLQSIDDYYLRFGQMSFLKLVVNQHEVLSSPKEKFENPKAQKLKMFYEIFKDWMIPYRVFETIEGILQKKTR